MTTKRVVKKNIHSSLIHTIKSEKELKCPLQEMDKQMWYTYTKEYYSVIKREQSTDTFNNMVGPERHTQRPDIKNYMLYNSIHMIPKKRQN